MRTAPLVFCVACSAGALAAKEKESDLIVHEWGTFLSMQGSDGMSLEGMYHEEHALPEFVHARSRDGLRLPSVRRGEDAEKVWDGLEKRESGHQLAAGKKP